MTTHRTTREAVAAVLAERGISYRRLAKATGILSAARWRARLVPIGDKDSHPMSLDELDTILDAISMSRHSLQVKPRKRPAVRRAIPTSVGSRYALAVVIGDDLTDAEVALGMAPGDLLRIDTTEVADQVLGALGKTWRDLP